MNSKGIGGLVHLATTASDGIVIINPSPFVTTQLAITHLDKYFDMACNVEEAKAKFGIADRDETVDSTANTPGSTY